MELWRFAGGGTRIGLDLSVRTTEHGCGRRLHYPRTVEVRLKLRRLKVSLDDGGAIEASKLRMILLVVGCVRCIEQKDEGMTDI
ncbi:hypothetical protein L6452_18241 [Arctium lappa]|uniref:Uncharacterized protein n=1 Tax=Arctium lappa TaxID=4217 RepID=A0ACB9C5S2_ARCLA|nr:hypothetical protein L6452_18241 [Arctium lappa]